MKAMTMNRIANGITPKNAPTDIRPKVPMGKTRGLCILVAIQTTAPRLAKR